MRLVTRPFLLPTEDVVLPSEWDTREGVERVALPQEMSGWDYQTKLFLSRSFEISDRSIVAQCQLGLNARLGLIVTARSSTTKVVRPIWSDIWAAGSRNEPSLHQLETVLEGYDMGGRLTLTSTVVFYSSSSISESAPSKVGQILWRDAKSVYLEGQGSQFPTYCEDFSRTRYEIRNAPWAVEVEDDDLDASFLGSVRVFLNENHKGVRKLLEGSRDGATLQLARQLEVDVARQLAMAALHNDVLTSGERAWDEGTVGAVLANLITMLWPTGENPKHLSNLVRANPSFFDAYIAHARGL